MPKLNFVTVCEKVIVEQNGPPSLISLFQMMKVATQGVPLPEKAISPIRWHVFCQWRVEPEEAGQTFTQILKVFNVDGTVFSEVEVPFANRDTANPQTNTNAVFFGLPISTEGEILTRVWIKGLEEAVGECRFQVIYVPATEVPVTAAPAVK